MRMLVHAKLPHEPFNTAVRNGTAGKMIERIPRKRNLRRCTSLNTTVGAEPS